MNEPAEGPPPCVGQVWADNDPRAEGRTVRIDRIEGRFVWATVITDRPETLVSTVGRKTRIAIQRLKPTRSGYRLVSGGR